MNPLALGTDLVPVDRVRTMLLEHGERFLSRTFTPEELRDCPESDRRRAERLASRMAAKEAVAKALGTGFTQGVSWTDIGVITEPSGAPRLVLRGVAADHARRLGYTAWLISLSDTEGYAMASVLAGTGPSAGVARDPYPHDPP